MILASLPDGTAKTSQQTSGYVQFLDPGIKSYLMNIVTGASDRH
jgi:hypothetical protein